MKRRPPRLRTMPPRRNYCKRRHRGRPSILLLIATPIIVAGPPTILLNSHFVVFRSARPVAPRLLLLVGALLSRGLADRNPPFPPIRIYKSISSIDSIRIRFVGIFISSPSICPPLLYFQLGVTYSNDKNVNDRQAYRLLEKVSLRLPIGFSTAKKDERQYD